MMYLEFHSDWSLIVSLFLIQLCGVKLVMEIYIFYIRHIMRELLYAMIKNSGYGTIIESASSTARVLCPSSRVVVARVLHACTGHVLYHTGVRR